MLTEERRGKIERVANNRQRDIVVVLEDVHDPHNAEAVFRSCDAFGIHDVYLIFEKQASFKPKKVGKRTSSSANKWLDFRTFKKTSECINQLKEDGYTIIGTVLDDKAASIYEVDFSEIKKLAILFGNEHSGLSETAEKSSDILFTIPMQGMLESLNISVSAGITIFEIFRQRRNSTLDFYRNKRDVEQIIKELEFRNYELKILCNPSVL